MRSDPSEADRRFAFGAGQLWVSSDGAVRSVMHPDGRRPMLLEENPGSPEARMHSSAQRWGKGFVITDRGGDRFDAPTTLEWAADGVDLVHRLGALELRISRRVGETWHEAYELRNRANAPITVGSLGISTPWRDVYHSSGDSLRRAVHAHVWVGGADSWVWAAPMDGSGPGLGLVLTEGELWSYSVESRDEFTASNVRGHLYLQVTDHARSPEAMGGQPEIVLGPGEVYRWSWRLDWYAGLAELHTAHPPMVDGQRLVAEVGGSLTLDVADRAELSVTNPVQGTTSGVRQVYASHGARRSRISLLFHPPLRDLVEARLRFVLDHQRALERGDVRRAAFVPYDNESGLTVLPGAWTDWSDVRERVGTALLLQEARTRGWGVAVELADVITDYERFVVDYVVAADGTVRGDNGRVAEPRLYNFPWFARFLLDQGDVDRALMIMDRYYELGGDHFLAFELGSVVRDLADELRRRDRADDGARLVRTLLDQAGNFLAYGEDLPEHEVNYEQSMVAPLLELLLAAYQVDPERVPIAELDRRLGWLRAFAADQPDVRLRHVPIRHWDGYWFGGLRMWGDVFPHYWSILSAGVYLDWPEELADPSRLAGLRTAGEAILRANLASFHADGSATCAFLYPSCVNGRAAYREDPLANDQDWALVYAMRYGLT